VENESSTPTTKAIAIVIIGIMISLDQGRSSRIAGSSP
jgi:hypothetical protein